MHSSYALSSDDFAVERDGEAGPLSDLWPGGYQPGDRLGVVLNQPMDPCGCSNLICATNTLFYDVLRDTQGHRRLLPLRRHVPDRRRLRARRLQPARRLADAQVRRRAAAHGRGACSRPSTTAASRCSCCPRSGAALPRRGRALDLECAACAGPLRRHLLAAHAAARAAATSACSATRSSRATSSRRSSRRPASAPASRRACAACAARSTASRCAAVEEYKTLPERRRRARAAGRDRGAAARPSGGLAPLGADDHPAARGADGRRSTPTSAPLDAATALSAPPAGVAAQPADDERHRRLRAARPARCGTRRSTRSSGAWAAQFAEWEGWDWISDFGDPVAEHHAVRETVGIWDESPLQKWLFRGPDALAAADYCFTSDMAGARRSARCATARSATSAAACSATAPSTTRGDNETGILVVTALLDRRRPLPQRIAAAGPRRRGRGAHRRACRTCSCRARARASCWSSLTDADIGSLRYFRFLEDVTRRRRARLPGLPHRLLGRARLRDLQPARERRAAVERAARPGPVARHPRPYGLAAVESLRIESGLIFIGFDYFPAYTSPFHMNLERMIKLDKPSFHRQGGARRPSTPRASRTAWRRS